MGRDGRGCGPVGAKGRGGAPVEVWGAHGKEGRRGRGAGGLGDPSHGRDRPRFLPAAGGKQTP